MKQIKSSHQRKALTLVELLVVIAVLALMGAVIWPQLTGGRRHGKSPRINCVNNLKQVGLAFRLWADDNNGNFPMQVSVTNGGALESANAGFVFPTFKVLSLSNELTSPKFLFCPADSRRTFATNFTTDFNDSKVSYFLGLDANQTSANMLLAGDRNLTFNGVALNRRFVTLTTNSVIGWSAKIHNNAGNVALADGSVQQLTSPGLQKALKNSGAATNRLALP